LNRRGGNLNYSSICNVLSFDRRHQRQCWVPNCSLGIQSGWQTTFGGRVRTVAVPVWGKQAINAWTTAAGIEEGKLLRPVLKSGKVVGESLSDWAVWSVVEQSAKEIGIQRFGAHDLRRTCTKLCRKNSGDLEQIKFLLGRSSIQTTERYLGSEQEIAIAVNDNLGL
jgi:integrase